jgi:hypothetical protein
LKIYNKGYEEEGHQEEGKLVKLWTFRPGVGKAFWKAMFLSLLLVLIETQVSVKKNEYLSLSMHTQVKPKNNLSFVLLHTTNDDQLLLIFFLCLHMVIL